LNGNLGYKVHFPSVQHTNNDYHKIVVNLNEGGVPEEEYLKEKKLRHQQNGEKRDEIHQGSKRRRKNTKAMANARIQIEKPNPVIKLNQSNENHLIKSTEEQINSINNLKKLKKDSKKKLTTAVKFQKTVDDENLQDLIQPFGDLSLKQDEDIDSFLKLSDDIDPFMQRSNPNSKRFISQQIKNYLGYEKKNIISRSRKLKEEEMIMKHRDNDYHRLKM